MARTVERVALHRGSLSARTRRRGLYGVLLVGFLYRALLLWRASKSVHALGSSVDEAGWLGPFLGQDRGLVFLLTESWWVGSPVYLFFSALENSLGLHGQGLLILQALLGLACAGGLYRLSVSWLGYPAAVLSSLFFTVGINSAVGGLMLLPEFFFAWGSILFLRHLNALVRKREPARCLRTGLAAGGLSILSGLGSLWVPFVLVWLPLMSRHFRGRAILHTSWRVLLGWSLVISPGILQGVMVHGSFTPPFANLPTDLATGLRAASVARELRAETPLDPAWRFQLQEQALREAGLTRSQFLGRAWNDAADPLVTVIRRARAFFGGTHDDGAYLAPEALAELRPRGLPTLPMAYLLALSWLGGFALLGSLRSFAPLYLGVTAPLLMAMGTGVGPQAWMAAMPFLCLFAGYGCARLWLGRRSPVTWILVPLILGVGYLLTRGF